jgi:GNAT superfamily N-acetyltransferase
MMMRRIREADPAADLPAVARLMSAARPEPVTEAELVGELRTLPRGVLFRRMLAVDQDGTAAGISLVQRPPWWGAGRYGVEVVVDPAYRGQGIGRLLYRDLEAFALGQGATRLDASVQEGDLSARAFAERRGFGVERHLFSSILELVDFDAAPFAPKAAQVAASGIRLMALAEIPDTPESRRKLYELHRTCALGIPGREPTFAAFEDYAARTIGAGWFRREAQFVALDGERWVGLLQLEPHGADRMWHRITGVDPAYRGRSIALALKLKAIAYARQAGYRRMGTNNDAENAPMLAVNRALGYRPAPGVYLMTRRVPLQGMEPGE